MTDIAPDFLLRGGWYALEQAGRLIGDAVTLFGAGSPSTAVGVALLAREEVGKSQLLFNLWLEQSQSAKPITLEALRSRLDDHVEKQRHGQSVIRVPASPEYMQRMEQGISPDPPAYWGAVEWIEKITRTLARRLPHDRVALRERSLYVDPVTGDRWSRPADISRAEAETCLLDVASDYSIYSRPWLSKRPPGAGEALRAALDAWHEKPGLPPVTWLS